MVKKFIGILICCIIICIALFYHTIVPDGSVFSLGPIPRGNTLAVVPLDSRPPCRTFTAQLGALAGYNIALPPLEIMDSRETPAQIHAVRQWLDYTLNSGDGAIISTDLLAFGGLWQNRLAPLSTQQSQELLDYLQQLRTANPQKPFYVYSVIPRLLVSDHILPDRWYQWHLMQWSISMDKKLQGLPYNEKQYRELQEEIPLDLKVKYTDLYKKNAQWNDRLIHLAGRQNFTDLTIGQDDAMLFGLPNYNRLAVKETFSRLNCPPTYRVTQGADEIGAMAVASLFLSQHHYRPKIYVDYGAAKVKDMLLHFVPLTLGEIAEDKIKLLAGQQVDSPTDADFVLFIHCGDENDNDYGPIADRVKETMALKPVALVDLTMNFQARESLLPFLLSNGTPLARLASYAGWNTASNSIGTALAQASILTGQAQFLPSEELPNLYAQNLTFNCARFLDDWAYQRNIRHKIRSMEEFNGINADATAPHTNLVENYIARELGIYKNMLLYGNLRRHAFYRDKHSSYYLSNMDYEVTLPWNRTFEIGLKILPTFRKK